MQEMAPDGEIGIPPFSPSPSRPRNLQELPRDADLPMVHRLMGRLQELKADGLTGLNLIATCVQRKIVPLQLRPSQMCEYTRMKDPQRHDSSRFASIEQFTLRMKRVTVHPSPEWEVGGLKAFCVKHSAPEVSQLSQRSPF